MQESNRDDTRKMAGCKTIVGQSPPYAGRKKRLPGISYISCGASCCGTDH